MNKATEWPIRLYVGEDGDLTVARAVLERGNETISVQGIAVRNPHDPANADIGDELAAGRALAELSRRLIGEAADDIAESVGKEPVVLNY